MKIGLWVVASSILLVVLEAFASFYWSQNFWPSQVAARWGKVGISFFAHGGMWGDLFLLPALMAWIVVTYGETWDARTVAIMAVVGVGITLANHLLLVFGQDIPDPLGWKGEKWSALIGMHFVYMSVYVALVGLFFFSPGVSVKAAVTVSTVLGIHVALGTHVLLGLLNRWGLISFPCPDFLANPAFLHMHVGVWATLAVLSTVAAGWHAGIMVTMIGSVLVGGISILTTWANHPINNV